MEHLFTLQGLVALATLIILEIVLGVDNIIFLAIVSAGVPAERRSFARKLGLSLALVGRIGMVFGLSALLGLKHEFLSFAGHGFSGKDLILLAGGLFLCYKAVTEIYKETELKDDGEVKPSSLGKGVFAVVVAQIVVVDMVFALDSVLTAVGLTKEYLLIVIAMTVAVVAMMFFADGLSEFIERHPSLKLLALAFLVLVGVLLIADAFGEEINRSYVYFAIMFSLAVEALNFRRQANLTREKREQGPVGL